MSLSREARESALATLVRSEEWDAGCRERDRQRGREFRAEIEEAGIPLHEARAMLREIHAAELGATYRRGDDWLRDMHRAFLQGFEEEPQR